MFVRTESFSQFLKLYPIVSVIVGIHIVIYLLLHIPLFSPHDILNLLAGVNFKIIEGDYWRLFTPIIVHFGFSHLLFNSFSLVLFGPALERALGKGLFLLVYIASGLGANLATLLIKPPIYSHIGASGAIFGLFGIYLSVIVYNKEAMPSQGKQIILPMAAIGVVMTFLQANINITAHIFGLISGFLIGMLLLKVRPINFYR